MLYNSKCKGDEAMAERKNFATPVDERIQEEFKAECKKQGLKMNEAIEILMTGFAKGEIQIKKEISYKIHQLEK